MSTNLNEDLKNAIDEGDFEEVQRLLLAGANPNYYPPDDKIQKGSLLHLTWCEDILEILIKHGARVNSTNGFRETPLRTAIYCYRDLEMVKILLKYGADPNHKDRRGNTPLNLAVRYTDSLKIIEELLKYGGDINIKNSRGFTPLDNSFQSSDCAKPNLLIKYGLLRNFDNNNYYEIVNLTPHHYRRTIKDVFSFYVDCERELSRLRGKDFLYKIVTSHSHKTNELTALSSVNLSKIIQYSTSYPIYFQNILDKMENIIDRAELLKKIEEIYFYTEVESEQNGKNKVYLNYDSIICIVKYLSNVDLVNFVLALNELTKVMPSTKEGYEEIVAKRPKLE